MPYSNIIIYGTDWCSDCIRARSFFNKHRILYTWVNIDRDLKAEQFVLQVNNSIRSVPTIIFNDGTILVEPSNTQLANRLGISQ
ncbi:MAG: NrdH-redoxin [Anaerolineales bacterium]|nr:NrdH-redoxin [Anaerolineales bacterium]